MSLPLRTASILLIVMALPLSGQDINQVRVSFPLTVLQGSACVANLSPKSVQVVDNGGAQAINSITPNTQLPIIYGLVIDRSGSMRDHEKLLDGAVNAAVDFIAAVLRPDRDRATLVDVRSAADLDQSLTSNPDQLRKAVHENQQFSGGTSLNDGLLATGAYVRKQFGDQPYRLAILVISDGGENMSLSSPAQTVPVLAYYGASVYALAIPGNRQGMERMLNYAKATGGFAFNIPKNGDYTHIFDVVKLLVNCGYVVSYAPVGSSAKQSLHSLAVSVPDNGGVQIFAPTAYRTDVHP